MEHCIIQMERNALDRWGQGDPSGFLDISSEDVVYFDPFIHERINGKKALTALYESIRGQIRVDNYELLNPLVQSTEDMAVLTFNYISWTDGREDRWNCTEVYRNEKKGWRIIQTHWSLTAKP